ncbi:hypothetical protein [Tolypothrix sp. FACHB-123]|nr:hypothetical protein [Tolypothrix sp. FACHB-123]
MPNDATCFKPGKPSNAVAPQCPMLHAPCPITNYVHSPLAPQYN